MTLTRREALFAVAALSLACRGRKLPVLPTPASFVEVGGVRLAYRLAGAGEAVLFLHGQGGNGASWDAQEKALAGKYQTLLFDQRGHGASSVPEGPYTGEKFAKDAAGLCKSLNINAAHVVGHSLGGAVALALALQDPSLVKSLTIINSSANFKKGSSRFRSGMIKNFIRLRGMPRFARQNCKLHLPDPGQEALCERLISVMGACPKDGYMASEDGLNLFDVSGRLGEIACPVMVIHSKDDPIPLEDKQEIASKVKQGKLVIVEDSRHIAIWDQPEKINQLLLEFLSGIPAQQ